MATKLQHLRLVPGHRSRPVVAGSPFMNTSCLRFLTDFEYLFSWGFITCFCGPLLTSVMTCHFPLSLWVHWPHQLTPFSKITLQKNVEGKNCDRCKPGFYNLQERNPQGCSECFCFGVSDVCDSLTWSVSQVRDTASWLVSGPGRPTSPEPFSFLWRDQGTDPRQPTPKRIAVFLF